MEVASPVFILIVTLITVPVLVGLGFWVRFLVKGGALPPSSLKEDLSEIDTKMHPSTPRSSDTRSESTVTSSTTLKEAVLENFRAKRNRPKAVTLQIRTSDIDAYQV